MSNHLLDTTTSTDFTHDVFLISSKTNSKPFTDHLYQSLLDTNRITVVRYDESIPVLVNQKFRISIVVLCENYAKFTTLLDELVKIFECYNDEKRKQKQVCVIFYKVEPSDVWLQKNCYESALIEHEKKGFGSDKVEAWRLALQRIGEIGGEHCRDDKYESSYIKKIVRDTYAKLPPPPLPLEIKNPVGLVSSLERLKSHLDIESNNGMCMLAICGDAGIGKTTLAAYLYNKIRHKFEAASFLSNIREKSNNDSINGLRELQSTLLYETVLETQTINVSTTIETHSQIIKNKLSHKSVLLVLDDVDSIKQLEALAGGCDWFGSGSRIIVTTRVEIELDKHEVGIKKYKMEELNYVESLELLCWYAFNMSKPREHYADICNDVVSYAKGFPRALKVLGSNLKGLGVEEWKMEMEKYRKVPLAFSFLVDSF